MVNRAERISMAISEKGISYAELEKITGVSKSALQRYATGQTKKIPIDVIEKIAVATGVSARYLMGWDEKTAPADGESDSSVDIAALLETARPRSEWREIIGQLSRENKLKLIEYARLLLLSQAREHPEGQE